MNYLQKYPNLWSARARGDDELATDFDGIQQAIADEADWSRKGPLTVSRDWIGQARRLRIPGIGAPHSVGLGSSPS